MTRPVVLCVDDMEKHLFVRKTLLETFGCEVKLATEAMQCLAAVTEGRVDLVLLDYHLANGENGEDLARDIRACRPKLPLVMLTGDPKLPESARLSVDTVLIKGADSPADLIATIQRLLPDASLRSPHTALQPLPQLEW